MSVPQIYKGPPSNVVLKWLTSLQIQYGIHFMFVGDCGKKVARNIFDEIIKRYG